MVASVAQAGLLPESGRAALERRELDAELRAAPLAVRDGDQAAVVLGDPFRDRETETRAAGRGAGRPPEPVEDARACPPAGSPGPASSTARNAASPERRTDDPDRAARRAVPDRVVDEDHHELAQPRRSRRRPSAGSGSTTTRTSAAAGRLRQRRAGIGGDVVEVERHAVERDGAGIRAGEEEQVVDEGREVLDLGVDVVERVADIGDRSRRDGGGGARPSFG